MTDAELAKLDPYFDALEDSSILVTAHNAQFEYAMSQALMKKTWGIEPPHISRFRCTASLARRAALPAKLEKLSEFLGTVVKDKEGKRLIKKFSMMQPAKKPTKKNPNGVPVCRIRPQDDWEDFCRFMDYCKQDVRAEQEVARRLAYFDEPINNKNFTLHEIINARGVTVNLKALRHAQKLIDEETEIVSRKFRELTGLEFTQTNAVLTWARSNGYPYGDLQAATVEQFLEEEEKKIGEPGIAEVALRLRASVSYAAVKKVRKMIDCAGPNDNRIRGSHIHHGATTGRASATLVQTQNLKRPTIDNSEAAYREICDGISRDMLELVYGPPLEVISSCIRHFVHNDTPSDPDPRYVIHPESESFFTEPNDVDFETDGCAMDVSKAEYIRFVKELGKHPILPDTETPLFDADYAGIEARITPWLAGQEDALKEYRRVDQAKTKEEKWLLSPYVIMASTIYEVPPNEVNKFPQRFVGKEAVLGCGFGLGGDRFRVQCAKRGYELPEGLEFKAVKFWRKKNNRIVKFWTTIEDAAKDAILHKGEVFKAGQFISFKVVTTGGIEFLLMRLPSGRKLAYPWPRIVPGKFEGTTAVSFYQNIKGEVWGHNKGVWGGLLTENAVQAVAADIMCNGAQNAEDTNYEICALIHDQALAYHREGQTPEEFVERLTDLPEWAKGLPLAAEGALVPFYKKD